MHGIGLAQDILKKIQTSKSKIQKIRVKVGETLMVSEEELKHCFEMVAKGTNAEGAELEVEIVPLKAVCADCKKEFNPKTMRLDCPHCGSTSIQISSGKELLIEKLS